MKYLESCHRTTASAHGRWLALTLLKHAGQPDHPKISRRFRESKNALGDRDPAKVDNISLDIYSTGLTIIFLVELDPRSIEPTLNASWPVFGYGRSRTVVGDIRSGRLAIPR